MGQIIIEIPQKLNRNYRLVFKNTAKRILSDIEQAVKDENLVKDDEILGLWADRKESVEEIARKLRKGWDRTEKNG